MKILPPIDFFIAFNRSQAIRYDNHVALEINVRRTEADAVPAAVVAKLLDRGALYRLDHVD